jgi:hypothetical protein
MTFEAALTQGLRLLRRETCLTCRAPRGRRQLDGTILETLTADVGDGQESPTGEQTWLRSSGRSHA